jgi:hypothetical protein
MALDQSFFEHPMTQKLRNLRVQVAGQAGMLNAREQVVTEQESKLRNQGMVPNTGPQTMQQNFGKGLPSWLAPGNVGEINKVIWPFWFTFTAPELAPNTSAVGNFSVTQEAPFIWMAMTKAIFSKEMGNFTYINPDDISAAGLAPGLQIVMRDAVSSRQFMATPIDTDHVGNPRFPTVLPTPQMFLPRAVVEIQFFNNSSTATYVPWISLFGYRVRLEDANNILSTVTG